MKSLRILSLLFCFSFLFFGGIKAQPIGPPDWKWQNPLPQGNQLSEVYFVDTQTGWAVGSDGIILKTSNGGNSWQIQNSGTNQWLNSVHFTNAQTGWAVGNNGIILKTTEGGNNWVSQTSVTTNHLQSVHFTDAQNGWAVGLNGTILKTSNGGSTWNSQTSGTWLWLTSIYFTNAQTGWVVGANSTILKTTNGGSSWTSQSSGSSSNWFDSVHFTDELTGWLVGQYGTILKTSNGGSSWISQGSGTTNWLSSIHFTDAQTGWAVGASGTILKTSNGGSAWISQASGTNLQLYSVHFSNAQTGWAVGSIGNILKTSNGATTWISQTSVTTQMLRSVHFTTAQIGWAVGNGGTILKTSNGGGNWSSQTSGTTQWLYSVFFTDAQTGFVVGWNGTILKTTNGGSNWINQTSGTTQALRSVYFTDAQTGWTVGGNGNILKTSNGGSSWSFQTSGTNQRLSSVYFIDSQIGWTVGGNGNILKTTNGGNTWIIQTSGTTDFLNSIHFSDAQTGWVVGNNGIILKTSNGGSSWSSQTSGTSEFLYCVYFTDAQTGWAVGDGGTILKTNNEGITWNSQTSGTPNVLNFVQFIDAQTGWTVGEGGTILTTITNNLIDPETPSSLISGNLFEKVTTNCNLSNIPVSGKLIKAEPGPYYGLSRNDGNYNLRVPVADTGINYTLKPVVNSNPAFQIQTVCPPSGQRQVLVDTLTDTLSGQDFGFEITPCHHLDVQLSSNRRRRCFVNTTSVHYGNQGSLSAPNAYILVEFPHWVRPLSASRSHVAINDSVWRFNLDTVSAGEWGSFTISDSVLCGDVGVLGMSQCTKATIYPAPDCPPQSNWSGAEVSVSGKCHNGFVELGIYNKTAVPIPDSVDYWVYLDSIQVKQAKVKLAAGDSLKLWVEAMGMPVYLTANQVANHPTDVFVTTAIEACNDTMPFFPRPAATRFPIAQRANSKTQCLPIIGAYDPNDKQVFPIGFTNQNIVAPNTRLEYLVRFQNTGNDTAFTVFVIDTLDQNLNVESFEMGAASHPYQLSMQTTKSGKTFLRWQFNNILLPDSNTNEPASNGFIQFRISPKSGLTLGSKVRNHAEIYFDFNPPIITNQTLTTYDVIVFKDSTLEENILTTQPLAPTLSTTQVSAIGTQTAIAGGNISNSGGPGVSARGVVWSTNPAPTISLSTKTQDGTGTGTFTSNLTGLQPNTLYYVRAYATNSVGTAYGEERTFTTLTPATIASVSTGTVSNITTNSASTANTIQSDGGATVTERGVVWDTNPNPTISLSTKTQNGTGTGTFTSNLTGLLPNTLYYVRAYATNSVGTAYGEERTFTTLTPATIASVSTGTVSNITTNSASTANTIPSDGGASVTERGVVWDTQANPTISLSTKTQDGTGTGAFTSNLTGLLPNTLYYVRAYATNSVGTAYGEERTFTTLFVSVDGLESQKEIRIFPNPVTKGLLNVEFSTPGTLMLFDARGKVLLEENQISGLKSFTLNLKPGFYFAKAQTEKGSQTVKLVVE